VQQFSIAKPWICPWCGRPVVSFKVKVGGRWRCFVCAGEWLDQQGSKR
jgi:transposase-like protein